MGSVKLFESKNSEKIDLEATNPNLKKVLIEILDKILFEPLWPMFPSYLVASDSIDPYWTKYLTELEQGFWFDEK